MGSHQSPGIENYYKYAPNLETGQTVNERYTVLGQIGSGAQARVFGVTDGKTGAAAVLKVPTVANESELARYSRESAVTKALSEKSDDIVSVLEAGVSNDYKHPFVYLALERMMGGNFEDRIQSTQAGTLEAHEVIKIATSAFRGVAAAHDAGLVHRDVRPRNIFLGEPGVIGKSKLGDFGIVSTESFEPDLLRMKDISPAVLAERLTLTNITAGSPEIMAPEIVVGEMGHTKAADSFAAGITLHYGLTGRHLILDERRDDHFAYMDAFQPPSLSEYGPDVPRDVGALAISLMDRNPANRPAMTEAAKVMETASTYC